MQFYLVNLTLKFFESQNINFELFIFCTYCFWFRDLFFLYFAKSDPWLKSILALLKTALNRMQEA